MAFAAVTLERYRAHSASLATRVATLPITYIMTFTLVESRFGDSPHR